MISVGIQDFSMKDLMRPEPLRVRRILSATINFAKFREEHLNEFEKHTRLTVRKFNCCSLDMKKISRHFDCF